MEIKHSIFRRGKKGSDNAGSYQKAWTLRLTFPDEIGNLKRKTYQFATRADAMDARPKLEDDLKKTQGQSVKGEKMTFKFLTEYAKKTFYKEAVIVEGRKVDGIRSYGGTMTMIKTLNEYFGGRRLADIKRGDLTAYKSWRIKTGNRRGKANELAAKDRQPISLATINRELATMRHLWKFAHAEGWIARDVFVGSKAIDVDAEKARTRTLKASEETLLLAYCVGTRTIPYKRNGTAYTADVSSNNSHLKAIILLALDSGLRRGEILKLSWEDLDLERGVVNILGTHTKTQEARTIGLTERTMNELSTLTNFASKGKIFPFNDFKRSWATAKKLAGIEGLTFHDLRRTYLTLLAASGVPMAIVGKMAGHADIKTTQKYYVSIDDYTIIQDVVARQNADIEVRLQQAEDGFVN